MKRTSTLFWFFRSSTDWKFKFRCKYYINRSAMRNNVDNLGFSFYTTNVIIISQKSTLLYHANIIHVHTLSFHKSLFLWICKLEPMSWNACNHEMCLFYWAAMRYYEDVWPFKGKCNMHFVCLQSGKKILNEGDIEFQNYDYTDCNLNLYCHLLIIHVRKRTQ